MQVKDVIAKINPAFVAEMDAAGFVFTDMIQLLHENQPKRSTTHNPLAMAIVEQIADDGEYVPTARINTLTRTFNDWIDALHEVIDQLDRI